MFLKILIMKILDNWFIESLHVWHIVDVANEFLLHIPTHESNFIQMSDFSNLATTFYDNNSAQLIYMLNRHTYLRTRKKSSKEPSNTD